MNTPYFYIKEFDPAQKQMELDEETSRHIVQVLRMKEGEKLNLTDGKGNLLICEIISDHKKHCTVEIKDTKYRAKSSKKITIAISLLKNNNRFEWFLEKATEIGVSEIIPLICDRTEKEKFRFERLQGICISAMLQSQQCWLPVLHEPVQYATIEIWKNTDGSNFIAHCEKGNKQNLNLQICTSAHLLICIGPEGDFTKSEIVLALQNNFIPVSLGETRLRSETAGVVAAALLCHI